jgi:hypothetical protein
MAWCLIKHRDNFTFTLPPRSTVLEKLIVTKPFMEPATGPYPGDAGVNGKIVEERCAGGMHWTELA